MAEKDPCSHKEAKPHGNCLAYINDLIAHGQLKQSHVAGLGKSSSFCKDHASSRNVQALSNYASAHFNTSKKLIEIMNFRCIKQMVDASKPAFNTLFSDLHGDKKRTKAFMKKHASSICSSRKKFDCTDIEDPLEKFCKERKHDKEIDSMKEEHKKEMEEFKKKQEEAMKKKRSGAEQNVANIAMFVTLLFVAVLF